MPFDQADTETYQTMKDVAVGAPSEKHNLVKLADWLKATIEATPYLSVSRTIKDASEGGYLPLNENSQVDTAILFRLAQHLGYQPGERPASKLRASSGGKVWLKTAEEVATP